MEQRKIEFSMISTIANKILVLKCLENEQEYSPSEILQIIKINGFEGFNYSMINKMLNSLCIENLIYKVRNGKYKITTDGSRQIKVLFNRFEDVYFGFKNFINKVALNKSKSIANLFENCSGIKLIPYTIKKFENCDEDLYFLKQLPGQKLKYQFEGRGLGRGNFENYLVCWQNSNFIKFVGIIESYDNQTRIMKLRSNSVKKLKTLITEEMVNDYVKNDFRFIRNKQTFTDESQIKSFIELVSFCL